MSGPWFDPNSFSQYYGGFGGGVCGVLGGMLGAAAGWLAPQGRGRRFVLGFMAVLLVLGILNLVAGLVALGSGQPYGIWYPLVLLGVIMTVVTASLRPMVKRRYAEAAARAQGEG